MNLPANLPNIKSARLPANYEAARTQIAECARIDECKDWADKAAALASYAKQVNDDSLMNMARRIKLRAHDRMGELLKAIESQQGKRNQHTSLQDGGVPKQSRQEAARNAGLSERQQKTAIRIASVPRAEFEAAVDSECPPTVTELAQRGTQPRAPVNNKPTDPDLAFDLAIGSTISSMSELSKRGWEDNFVVGISIPVARRAISEIDEIQGWLIQLKIRLEKYCVQL